MPAAVRYLPERSLPPYTYVPGQTPHPIRDPAGHMYGHVPPTPILRVDDWQQCPDYLWGIDLFNHGFYWEAHEAWEGLWHVAGRQGPTADFLKGLIKLAAAGVKSLEGNVIGRQRHLRRAVELLEAAATASGGRCMGLELSPLCAAVGTCMMTALKDPDISEAPVALPLILTPTEGDSSSTRTTKAPR